MTGPDRHVLVVHCHPVPESFDASLRRAVTDGAESAGLDHELIDLYGEGFDPAPHHEQLTAATGPVVDGIGRQRQAIRRATELAFVYPTWWSGTPAMLKGWFDLVITGDGLPAGHPHHAPADVGHLQGITVVTTHGSGRPRNLAQGQGGRAMILRALRTRCRLRCHTSWLALYDMDRATQRDREEFIELVYGHFADPSRAVERRGGRDLSRWTGSIRRR